MHDEDHKNYRPASNLFMSQLVERVVALRLIS